MSRNTMLRFVMFALGLLGLTGSGLVAASPNSARVAGAVVAQATPTARTFPETGKAVAGQFLDYWEQHGGLAQQGYPISGEFQEKSASDGNIYTVQYFERAVFEKHPNNDPPYDTLLSQLGRSQYKETYGEAGAPNQKASTDNPRLFSETSKTVGGKFRAYWEKNGGLMQQGYPISDEFQEKSKTDGKTYTVQYFERAVFELHPENQAPFDVLLSQLGTFQYKEKYPTGSPDTGVVYPVVSLEASCLLGGSVGGAWAWPESIESRVKEGQKYNLYKLTGPAGSAAGSAPHTEEAPCPDTRFVDITVPGSSEGAVLAVAGTWNVQPRLPRVESTDQAVYRQAVADVLTANGLKDATVSVQQILRVDLEGDGENEVLVTATHYANPEFPSIAPGDYSVVFLRKVIDGKVVTTVLGGEFYTESSEFAAPGTYRVSSIADVNGDGKMEVILYGFYYEGHWTTVLEVDGSEVQEVLSCGCGA